MDLRRGLLWGLGLFAVSAALSTLAFAGFATPVAYPVEGSPGWIAVGDFNGDGALDLAVSSTGPNRPRGIVSILLNKGDGTFQNAVTYVTGRFTTSVAVGDFNTDGKLDLVVSNSNDHNVGVLLGNGDGTFQPQLTYPTGEVEQMVAVGDFNGDAVPDLAIASIQGFGTGGTVGVMLGNGDGSFQPLRYSSSSGWTQSLVVGDFNLDGKLDVVEIKGQPGHGGAHLFLGDGDGTLKAAGRYRVGSFSEYATVADFNQDGNLDLAVVGFDSGLVGVLLGNGDGTFQKPVTYSAGSAYAVFPAAGDFDGDGKIDLAVTAVSNGHRYVAVLLGNGDGTFQPRVEYRSGGPAGAIATGDLNGDGRLDLVVVNRNAVSVLLNTGGP